MEEAKEVIPEKKYFINMPYPKKKEGSIRKLKILKQNIEVYRYYRDKQKGRMTIAMFGKVIKEFNSEVSRLMIQEGFTFKVPFGLGFLRIMPYKLKVKIENDKIITNQLKVDWYSTIKGYMKKYPEECPTYKSARLKIKADKIAGKKIKLIFFFADNTNGYKFKVAWEKSYKTKAYLGVYKFAPSKDFRIALKNWVTTNDFYQLKYNGSKLYSFRPSN